jgi:hypothetical protein
MDFIISATQSGNGVQFEITASSTKEALEIAKVEAKKIFGWNPEDETPKVKVKPAKEDKE